MIFSADYSLVAATPVFSPAGAAYTSDQTVTISSVTLDTVIYYTTDGSDPTTASTAYAGVVSVAGNGTVKTLKAIATKLFLARCFFLFLPQPARIA
jgi:hypothetical protein